MTAERELSALMQRAAAHAPTPGIDLIDAGIREGQVRRRRRRQLRIGAAGLAAAAMASAIAFGVGAGLLDRSPDPAHQPQVTGFGVTPEQMAPTLVSLLPNGSLARTDEDLPVGLAAVLTGLGFPDPSGGAVTRSGVADVGDSVIGVVVRRDSTDTARVEAACADQERAEVTTTCDQTKDGVLLLQFPGDAGVATFLAGDGWLVQVATSDAQVISEQVLAAIAEDSRWLR